MNNEVHKTVTAETPYHEGGVFEASAFAKGDKWSAFWESKAGGGILTQRYVVKEGDTLESVSELFYGGADGIEKIREANPQLANELEVGRELIIHAE